MKSKHEKAYSVTESKIYTIHLIEVQRSSSKIAMNAHTIESDHDQEV